MYPGPLGLYTLSSLFRRSIFKPLILFLLKSWRKGLRRWSFPGSRVWMPLKCFKIPESTRAQPPGVSFIWLATPTKIWEIPPKNFLDNQHIFLKDVLTFQNSATGQNGLRLVNEGLSFSRIVLSAKYFFDKSKYFWSIQMVSRWYQPVFPINCQLVEIHWA